MRQTLPLAIVLVCSVARAQSPPVAMDDFYNTMADSTLAVDAPGVLVNDTGSVPIEAVLQTAPENGTLELASDGSFVYAPNPGFSGVDMFEYVARTVDLPEQLVVDPLLSGVRMFATIDTPIGDGSDSDSSAVKGTMMADVVPNTEPFSQIHLTSLDLILSDAMSLTFEFLGGLTSVNVDTQADSIALALVDAGAAAAVSDGSFSQAGNQVGMTGTLHISGSLIESPGPQTLDVAVPSDFTGTLVQNDSELTLDLPLYAEGSFDVSGNTVDVTLQGAVSATGPLVVQEVSNLATVGIVVSASGVGTEGADEASLTFALRQNFPNPVDRSTTIRYELPMASSVRLSVYDALGRRVATLVDRVVPAGTQVATLDASTLPVGMYFYRLEAGSRTAMKKLIVLR